MSNLIERQKAIDELISEPPEMNYGFYYAEKIKALPSAQPEPQWIPVGERLPDMWDERYLVSLAWGGIGVMEYKSTGFHNYGSFTPVPIESITAWMPLPEPYRAERRTDDANDIT